MLTTPGKGKLSVDNMHPWGQLDWFALNQDYATWRLIYPLLQLMQMAPPPFNYMMVQNYSQARRYNFKFTIQTKPLPLSLWRAAVGCAADVPAPDIAPANLPLHSVGLSLLSCQKRNPWGCWKLGLALPCPVCYGLTHLLCMILVLLVQKYGL